MRKIEIHPCFTTYFLKMSASEICRGFNKTKGTRCTCKAKANGYCGKHQNQAGKKIFTKEDKEMPFDILDKLLNAYIEYDKIIIEAKKFSDKIRRPNIGSEITENIARFAYQRYFNIKTCWINTKIGDIICSDGKKIEVKAFSSDGPSSFGPTETWDILLFVDARLYVQKIFSVYMIDLDNRQFGTIIKINSTELYLDKIKTRQRPRIAFDKIQEQLKIKNIDVKCIFTGNLQKLCLNAI